MWNTLAIIKRVMRKLIYKIRKFINALNITSGAVLKTIMIFLIIIVEGGVLTNEFKLVDVRR